MASVGVYHRTNGIGHYLSPGGRGGGEMARLEDFGCVSIEFV